jgi:hypothetical protein
VLEPGQLEVHDALHDPAFFGIVATAIAEACIGETLAAVEVAEACEQARDPEVRRVLERISEDEARHAELGWRFLRWALERADLDTRRLLVAHADALVRAELEILSATTETRPEPNLAEHGLLSPAVRQAVRQAALSEMLGPLVAALGAHFEVPTRRRYRPSAGAARTPPRSGARGAS